MFYDEDDAPSSSTSQYFESPHEAKRRALQQKLEKQGKKQAAEKQGANLRDLKLALLKSQVGKDDEKAPKDEKGSEEGMGTKTREQEIKASAMGGDTKPDTDRIVQRSNERKQVEKTVLKEEIQPDQA